jgi:uncharacterized protein
MQDWLIPAFFLTALLYASVGFGGGSTYSALLALTGANFRAIPIIAPICNLIVVSGSTFRFQKAGLLPWRQALPLALASAPFAFLGGLTPIKEKTFLALLAFGLLVAGITLLVQNKADGGEEALARPTTPLDLLISVALGYLAGLVGLGGGIFLAPWLHFTKWNGAKAIAATSSLYILINSLSGLAGQFVKLASSGGTSQITGFWPLALAVLAGGLIGNHLSIQRLSPSLIRRATAVLILYVAVTLLWTRILA